MKKIIALVLALVLCVGLLAGCGGPKEGGVIKIGYVNPTTGALAGNGEGVNWLVAEIENYVNNTLGGIEVDGTKKTIDVIVYDSGSDSAKCGELAAKLCDEDEVDMIIAIQTPETVIPVVNTAENYDVPCIAIQAPVNPVAGNLAVAEGEWTVHAFWTIEKVYEQYKALWAAAGYLPNTGAKVGIAFANDADGSAWYDIFKANLDKDGYVLVDPGKYPSLTNDFSNVVNKFKEEDIDILAGTNIPPDFATLYTQLIAAGVEVGCVTMGKCCLLEGDINSLEGLGEGIMTEVWWAPTNPFTSALTGISAADLGAKYSADNEGRAMPQPAAYGYAALELAVQAFQKAGTTDKAKVVEAMRALDTETVVGPIKYDQKMGGLTYGDTVIAGGQWQMEDGKLTLKVIDNTVYPIVPKTGDYKEGNATNK